MRRPPLEIMEVGGSLERYRPFTERPLRWYDRYRNLFVMVAVTEGFVLACTTPPTEESPPASVRMFRSVVVHLLPITFSRRIGLTFFEAELVGCGVATLFVIAARAARRLASCPRTCVTLSVDSADVVEPAGYAACASLLSISAPATLLRGPVTGAATTAIRAIRTAGRGRIICRGRSRSTCALPRVNETEPLPSGRTLTD